MCRPVIRKLDPNTRFIIGRTYIRPDGLRVRISWARSEAAYGKVLEGGSEYPVGACIYLLNSSRGQWQPVKIQPISCPSARKPIELDWDVLTVVHRGRSIKLTGLQYVLWDLLLDRGIVRDSELETEGLSAIHALERRGMVMHDDCWKGWRICPGQVATG